MAWSGHIADQEVARKSAGSALGAQKIILVVDSDLASVTSARAACASKGALLNIADQIWIRPCQRGFSQASRMSGTFSSSFATLYGSLPDSAGHIRQMIQGS